MDSTASATAEQQLQQYLRLLYPTLPPSVWMVVSWKERYFQSRWFPVDQSKGLRPFILKTARQHDVYIGLGLRQRQTTGRGTSADVGAIGTLWAEFDHSGGVHSATNLPSRDELLQFLEQLPFRFSLIVDSTGGFQCYIGLRELWIFETDQERETAQRLLRRFQRSLQHLAQQQGFPVDTTSDLSRVLRPPSTFNHKRGTPQPVTILQSNDIRYDPTELDEAYWMLEAEAQDTAGPAPDPDTPPAHLDPIVAGCAWLRHCRNDAAILPEPEWYSMLGIVGRCVDGEQHAHTWSQPYPQYDQQETARKLAHALKDAGPRTCTSIREDLDAAAYCDGCHHWGRLTSPIGLGYVRQTRNRNGTGPPADPAPVPPWPIMDKAAYYGVVGDIVQAIAPNTESDPVAVLLHLLVMLGCAMGREPYVRVEATRHHPNLFVCLVGKTSRARKGTSADYAEQLVTRADTGFAPRILGGLSSGEGLLWQVRDAIGEEGKKGYDPGADDKRLCLLESEFARGLAKMSQEGNVLSAILRQAYDHGTLRSLVSGRTHAPVTATGAHVALIAHVTVEELQRLLTETEAANGFGNRILWACVQRARLLPDGAGYPEEHLTPAIGRLQKALHAARSRGRLSRSSSARTLWHRLYPLLTEERAGLLGALTARAEAHTLRLSMLYALLDATDTIAPEHLDAAYAVWRYCDDSARYIFGTLLGDPIADEILQMLRVAGTQGLTRTDLANAFGRHVPSARIGHALRTLQREQLVRCSQEETGGRPVERWVVR